MPRVTHDEPGKVYTCPSCDVAGAIYERVGRGNSYVGDPAAPYMCEKCRATFYQLVEREERPDPLNYAEDGTSPQAGKHGLGRSMADMTVEEFDAIMAGERDAA